MSATDTDANSAIPPTTPAGAVHVCVATGQNAANLIPLEQYAAQEVWILQTPTMRGNAGQLALALRRPGRHVQRLDFDDSSPAATLASAAALALKLDGRQVVLHVTGGTKVMVLALRDELRLIEAGSGRLDILYADTLRQQIDWLGEQPRCEPMADVLDLQKMLQVQGYRIDGDSRHAEAQKRAQVRAAMTRELGDNATKHGRFLSTLPTMARRAADAATERELAQQLHYPPGGAFARLLEQAVAHGLLQWDGDVTVNFMSAACANYFAGAWLEEFVLLKLTGGLSLPGRFSCNLQVLSHDDVRNELDAMLIHRNRALLIECKTGRQTEKVADALYKLAQLRDRLGGSVASALYLSAQDLSDEHRQRAAEYKIETLCGEQVSQLVSYLRAWKDR